MGKFKYRMQNILEIDYKLESQAKTAFSIANGKLKNEEEKLKTLISRKQIYDLQAKALRQGNLNILDIQTSRKAIETMKHAIRQQMGVVSKAEKEVEQAKEKLSEAMIERKTQEKLKEKKLEEFMSEQNAQENKTVDELVSYQFHSKLNL